MPEILDELHEVLHGLDDLRDGEVVEHLLAVPAQLPASKDGGVTGRPETMCPRTKVRGPLVPKINRLL